MAEPDPGGSASPSSPEQCSRSRSADPAPGTFRNTTSHSSRFQGYRARAGSDSAPTHSSAFPQLQAGAAETARREFSFLFLHWARVGDNPQGPKEPPRQGISPSPSTEATALMARGEGALASGSDGTHHAQAFENQFYLNKTSNTLQQNIRNETKAVSLHRVGGSSATDTRLCSSSYRDAPYVSPASSPCHKFNPQDSSCAWYLRAHRHQHLNCCHRPPGHSSVTPSKPGFPKSLCLREPALPRGTAPCPCVTARGLAPGRIQFPSGRMEAQLD